MNILKIVLAFVFLSALQPLVFAQKTSGKVSAPKFVVSVKQGDTPESSISFSAGGKKTFIDKIPGEARALDKEECKRMKIPANAVATTGAWWAGQGNYYYAVRRAKGYVIYGAGDGEELNESERFKWKKIKQL
jgi:hypothetical protein